MRSGSPRSSSKPRWRRCPRFRRPRAGIRAQALVLQEFARDNGLGESPLVSAALHARVAALAKWTALCDPRREENAEAVVEAAARYPLSDLAGGVGFEAEGFQEMVLFIEELPW
jgi:hypothetical protein